MIDREWAKQLIGAASKSGGSIFLGDVDYQMIEMGLQRGWLAPVGVGHCDITSVCVALAN